MWSFDYKAHTFSWRTTEKVSDAHKIFHISVSHDVAYIRLPAGQCIECRLLYETVQWKETVNI